MNIRTRIGEIFSGQDTEGLQYPPEYIIKELEAIISSHGQTQRTMTEFIEYVFTLYRYEKTFKSKLLIKFIDDVDKRKSIKTNPECTYFGFVSPHDDIYDYDAEYISEFVIRLSFLGYVPDKVISRHLNKDVIAFMEL